MGSLCLVLVVLQLSWTLSSSVPPPSSHLCLPHQRKALLHFKTTIAVDCRGYGDPKIDIESWNKSIVCCSWEGVKCDHVTGHIIGIDLSQSCLVGSLFANTSLFQLHNLQWLDLSSNNLGGSLLENTSSSFHFHGLRQLNLAYNAFDGAISTELFSQLVSLTHLNLSGNAFSGLISHQISGFDMLARNLTKLRNLSLDGVLMSDVALTSFLNLSSSLEHLSLSYSQLHGEFPAQVSQLPNLKVLHLSVNDLTGYLPNTNCSSGLELLDLSLCGFKGSIPASFGNLTQIISIHLQGISLEGQIPDVFGNIKKLTSLIFSSNNLSGPLPITIFNLTKITHLDLSNNHLEGPLPNHVSGLQFLEKLRLFNNSISGGVPSWLFTLPSLPLLDLRYNKLVGPIDRIQKPSSIQEVDLSYNNICGPIPDSIFNLVNLTRLDLSSNNLSGVIKSDMLSKLMNLEALDVSSNSLLSLSKSGNEFPNFFQTSKLWVLDLSNNMISGGISKWEAEGWEGLAWLDLSHNFLTALEIIISKNKLTGNIPPSICNLSSLVVLDLSDNRLSGAIPDCLGNFSYLGLLDLQMNKFIGEIPNSFVSNTELSHLLLNDNQLEGLVPPSLANCTSLELLNLGNNKLTDRFPYWLTSLQDLQVIILRLNRFYGSLSNSIVSSNFSALRIIDLSGNDFTGTLPTKLFRNLRVTKDEPEKWLYSSSFHGIDENPVNVTLKRLEMELTKTMAIFVSMDLSNNQFCGKIPEDVGQLISLQMLNFSHNIFTSSIPASFGNLVELESLDLSSNKLSGKIPAQMTKLTFLEVLNLSNNNLVGPIPHGNQFHTFDNDSYRGNLGLCSELIPFFWQVVMMGYGSGVVLGLSLGYIVFTTGKPWWFVIKVERDWQYNFTRWVRRNRTRRS
ncbi:hypothetical protein ES319_D08G022600v1 [Gossypium barbadense]|uniref:Leucine-rich repeat-containing N-terminal plant-type domain-containing protein n=1 Tax=Gossypium barbadense TaxID=3634 RepID=A0A5J5Q9X3_GOSBA|nr:hypothetical protein ES319_D08G022600v1 [Gossypium barbadense]